MKTNENIGAGAGVSVDASVNADASKTEAAVFGFMQHDDGADASIVEKIVSSERIFDGKFLHIDNVHVVMPDGAKKTRDVVRHPGAVALLVVDREGRVLLERQYRTALDRVVIEIPAGKIDVGETPEAAATRELKEEAGIVAGRIEPLVTIASSVGFCDELVHIYRALDVEQGEAELDDGEFLKTFWADSDELVSAVLSGKIQDAKTVVAALMLARAGE